MTGSVSASLRWQSAQQAGGGPNERSIALLPLHNLSGTPTDEPLCAGITGDIIHNLTRFRDLTVIAQHSALHVQALALAPGQIAEHLGVRYVLTGDLRREGERPEIHAQLFGAESEQVIWSAKYDGPLGDVFAFQDEVTEVIAANLAAEIRAAEWRRAVDSAPAELSAYGLLLRGQYLTHRYQRAANLEARFLFERARRLDPGYGRSYAALSRTFNLDWRYAWSDDPGAALDRALELAELATSTIPSMPAAMRRWGLPTCTAGNTKRPSPPMSARSTSIPTTPTSSPRWATRSRALASSIARGNCSLLPCLSTPSARTGISGTLAGSTSPKATMDWPSTLYGRCETSQKPTACWRQAAHTWARWTRHVTTPRS
jgi:TolB-like protein